MEEGSITLTEKEKKHLPLLREIAESNFTVLIQKIEEQLLHYKYTNVHTLFPADFSTLVREQAETFLCFLQTLEPAWAMQNGKLAVEKGLDITFILALSDAFEALYSLFIPESNPSAMLAALKIIKIYRNSFERVYYRESKKQTYNKQQQLYNSLLETVSGQKEQLIRAQKERIKIIEEENRLRTSFMVNLAHEIKGPLMLLKDDIDNLKNEAAGRQMPSLSFIEEHTNAYKEMVLNILDTEKIIKGMILYNHSDMINVSARTEKKIAYMGNYLKKTSIRIVKEIDENLFVKIAPNAFDRILDNIIDNAVKYNRKSGSIHISLEGHPDTVVLKIKDTGIGISLSAMDHLYKPYYQLAHKTVTSGIGAGLAIVKGIVDEVAGSITISSRENEGTTVTIAFIREKDCAVPAPDSETDTGTGLPLMTGKRYFVYEPDRINEEKNTILVVEDDITLIPLLQKQMELYFNVFFAGNGITALSKLKTMPMPAVIVSDIRMRDMDGFEFYNTVKQEPELSGIMFIFITAKTSADEKIKGLKAGAVDYIIKPFEPGELVFKIMSLINTCNRLRENERMKIFKQMDMFIRKSDYRPLELEHKFRKFGIRLRERDIILGVMEGLAFEEIARRLFISPQTVKTHIGNIYRKCNVHDKVGLIRLFQD